ncbi:MAG: hypothetical protein ACK4SL_01230 [Candidatus Paceibacteria bacterium]
MSSEQPSLSNERLPYAEKVKAIHTCLLAALGTNRTLQDKDLIEMFNDYQDLPSADLLAKTKEAEAVIAAMQELERIALTMRIGGILSRNPFTN